VSVRSGVCSAVPYAWMVIECDLTVTCARTVSGEVDVLCSAAQLSNNLIVSAAPLVLSACRQGTLDAAQLTKSGKYSTVTALKSGAAMPGRRGRGKEMQRRSRWAVGSERMRNGYQWMCCRGFAAKSRLHVAEQAPEFRGLSQGTFNQDVTWTVLD
jgi:hypothetical protein